MCEGQYPDCGIVYRATIILRSLVRQRMTTVQSQTRLNVEATRHLSALVAQLVALRNEPESDEHGILRATEAAFDVAFELLVNAAIVSAADGRYLPRGCASTDSEGGIRIEWVRPSCSVHLVVGAAASSEAYIYHERGPQYGTEPATVAALGQRLSAIDEADSLLSA